jgi:hypothetical protein
MLVAAAVIAYMGAFTAPWRAKLVQGAVELCAAQAREGAAGPGSPPTGPLP